MGQIVIDIPTKKKRRYIVTNSKKANDLLNALDASAIRVRNDPPKLSSQQAEDIEDLIDAKKALDEYRRTGVSYSWEEIKAELGL
jgi:hypothetical protein